MEHKNQLYTLRLVAQRIEHMTSNHAVVGSNPTQSARHGPLAQLAEQSAHNRSVPGSIPGGSTKKFRGVNLTISTI